ncbi:snare associated Golgi protein [Rhizophagus diaphanus]|nr:snare associated Golgi protein [Rhizophagus diaphanus] [Rhizophagus sp. MUCL 43196]
MKIPELDISISNKVITSTIVSDKVQSPTTDNIISLPLLHKKTSSSSLNSIISHDKNITNNNDNKFILLKKLQPWTPFIVWAILSLITLSIFLIYHKEIFLILDKFAHTVKLMGIFGVIIFYLMIFLTTFPLVIGYSTLITLSGFIFGFGIGFLISYIAALTGAITVFYLSRKWFKKYVGKVLRKHKSMNAIIKAVEKKGFKLLFLIRLAPYPYNVLNTLLSATHLSLQTFIGATALSLFKLMIHVWIGSKLSSFSIQYTFKETSELLKVGLMVVGISIGIGVIIYVWISAKKVIKEVEQDEIINDNKEIYTPINNITTIRHRRGSSIHQEFIIDNFIINNENTIMEENDDNINENSNNKQFKLINNN